MKYPVSETQKQLVLGSLLGDGHICKSNGSKGNAGIRWRHGIKQKEYLEWKNSLLDDLEGSGVKEQKGSGYSNKTVCYAVSKYSHKLNPFLELVGSPKRVTRKLLNLLSPLGLAVWYMDDGCLEKKFYVNKYGEEKLARLRVKLCTQSFSLEEHWTMQQYFKVVWNIEVAIHKAGKDTFNLVMNRTNAEKFLPIITEYIHPSMQYKVDLSRERS